MLDLSLCWHLSGLSPLAGLTRLLRSDELFASNFAPAASAGSGLSDFTELEIEAANSLNWQKSRPVVTATTSKSGENHDQLVMVPVRHVDMLVWESPEQVGIPEFRLPSRMHIHGSVAHVGFACSPGTMSGLHTVQVFAGADFPISPSCSNKFCRSK
jgi:hypothetical protein